MRARAQGGTRLCQHMPEQERERCVRVRKEAPGCCPGTRTSRNEASQCVVRVYEEAPPRRRSSLLAKWPMATMVLVTEVPMLAPITLL